MLAARQHDASDRHHVHLPNDVAYDGEGVLSHFSVRRDVIRTDQIQIVDLGARNEFVDFDGPRALERDRLDLFIVDLDITALVDLIALDDLVLAHFFAGVLIDLAVADAVARFLVDLVEADLLALAGRGEKLDRTRHQGKAQEALPVRTRGHGGAPNRDRRSFYNFSTHDASVRCPMFPIRSRSYESE